MGYSLGPVYRNAAVSCAKDPVTGKVYCCSYGYNEKTKELCYVLSTWNLEGMSKDSIALLSKPMQVMACDSDGNFTVFRPVRLPRGTMAVSCMNQ